MSRRIWLLPIGVVAAVFVVALFAVPGAVAPVHAAASTCSIGEMAAGQDIALAPALSTSGVSSAALGEFAADYPDATAVESAVVQVHAPSIPPLDGHSATVVAFNSRRIIPAAGPVDANTGPYGIACGLVFYDAGSGAFLGDVLQLATVAP